LLTLHPEKAIPSRWRKVHKVLKESRNDETKWSNKGVYGSGRDGGLSSLVVTTPFEARRAPKSLSSSAMVSKVDTYDKRKLTLSWWCVTALFIWLYAFVETIGKKKRIRKCCNCAKRKGSEPHHGSPFS